MMSSTVTTTLATSQEIRDRGSTFVGYVYRARTADEAKAVRERHARGGSRGGEVKPSRTGLGGPDDFTVVDGYEDGGERWAGGRILGVMKREAVIDAVVIVSRWFGETLLGPIRFTHIEMCASEVCRRFKKIEEMDECIQTLKTLDDVLAMFRAELAAAHEAAGIQDSADNSRTKKVHDYRAMQNDLDLAKAKRLIHARECAVKTTKALIEKCKTST